MAINPLSARARQAGIPGLLARERFETLQGFLTTPHVVRGSTEVYEIVSGQSLTLATGPLFLSGVRFRFTSNRAWNGTPGIIVPDGCFVDILNIECTTAATTLKNMVRVMGGARIGEIRMIAPQQVNNASDFDVSCINVVGPNAHIGRVYSEAFDKVISFGGQISNVENSGGGAHYCSLGELVAVGYQKALQVKGSRGFSAGSIMAHTRSEFAQVSPGRNVVHIDDCDMLNIDQIIGRNTTEHGIYVSGGEGDNTAGINGTRFLNFGQISLSDVGQTGVKIKSNRDAGLGGTNHPHMSVNIGSVSVRGAGVMSDLEDPDDPGSGNSDGLRVENVLHLNVGNVTVFANDTFGTPSSAYGIHLNGVQYGSIAAATVASCQRAGLYIRDHRGDNGRFSLPALTVLDAKSHAVHLRHPTGAIRSYHIKGRADTVAGNLIRIEGSGTEAPSGSASYIEMDYTKVTGSVLVRSGDPDIKVKTTDMNSTFT